MRPSDAVRAAAPIVGAPPAEVYAERLAERREAVARDARTERRLAWLRLAIAAAGAALLWPVLIETSLSWAWLSLPAAAFVATATFHDRIIRRRRSAERGAAFYERGLARLEDRWAGAGEPGIRHLDAEHPYAADLDLFGHGSLFELLCACRTRAGERALASWLLAPAAPPEIRARQGAIEDLRGRLDLREDLARLGGECREAVDSEALVRWGAAAPKLGGAWGAGLAAGLGLTNLAALAAWILLPVGPVPLGVSAAAGAAFSWTVRRRVREVLRAADRPARELVLLSALLERLEREPFRAPRLQELRAALDGRAAAPSRRIARLARLVEIKDSRGNQLFAPLAALALLGTQVAFAIERWRGVSGAALGRWVAAIGEFEALASLAGYAYEHPRDPFPEIVEGEPRLEGEALGHPLLPAARCVRNDLRLDGERALLLVSGSNMSGKSTFLRTAGVNVVLAQAGGAVRARSLRISPLRLGACLRVQDSLQEGTSRFYAEILRLRRIFDLGKGPPGLLFLLDEILHGTNSHDRRAGAEAVVRGLLSLGAIGLVTTHDLALARIAEDLAPRAENVHFGDRVEGGRIVFDFRLEPGVAGRGNALALMRAIGLDV